MAEQITNHIMMIRPVSFRMNEETAVNNYYQQSEQLLTSDEIQNEALKQFDDFVEILRQEGVEVTVFDDRQNPSTPDSIFPNNWVSFHRNNTLRVYPMFAENRRLERREDILEHFSNKYEIDESLLSWEANGQFLEGTGSIILDRENLIAYAALSERTMIEPLNDFCSKTGYRKVTFIANQTVGGARLPIYHTNVMMCVGKGFAVVCLDSIDDPSQRKDLVNELKETGKEVIEISERQVEQFAGNMLQMIGSNNLPIIVMSKSAFQSLNDNQLSQLGKHGKLVHSPIHTIEKLGGGSARCMIAEVF